MVLRLEEVSGLLRVVERVRLPPPLLLSNHLIKVVPGEGGRFQHSPDNNLVLSVAELRVIPVVVDQYSVLVVH